MVVAGLGSYALFCTLMGDHGRSRGIFLVNIAIRVIAPPRPEAMSRVVLLVQ